MYKSISSNSDTENASDAQLHCVQKKSYNRMEFKDKLQIITAVEKGQTKVDIGREFGIHPRTVTYIYKQKDAVLKKCKQKYSVEADGIVNINQSLLNWFVTQMSSYNAITEKHIRDQAEEISLSTNNDDFRFTKAWFTTFRKCNNIVKHKGNADGVPEPEECLQWSKVIEGYDENDIYVGGTCALLHKDTLHNFLTDKLHYENLVSILMLTNITGSDKHKLITVSKDAPQTIAQSLPLQFYHKDNAQIDSLLLSKILNILDNELKATDRKILIAFHLPDTFLDGLQLQQIKVLKCSDVVYISKTFERLVNCFKYHYRKLQIMQTFSFRKDESDFMDYINLLSLAWHSVSPGTVHYIFHPRFNNCYYFYSLDKHYLENEENDKFSLTDWCETHGIPLKLENEQLDNFITCDKHIASLDSKQGTMCHSFTMNMNEWLTEGEMCNSVPAVDAFQAAKRLLRYIQSENGSDETINSIRLLEDQLEYEACVEIQQNIEKDSTNDM